MMREKSRTLGYNMFLPTFAILYSNCGRVQKERKCLKTIFSNFGYRPKILSEKWTNLGGPTNDSFMEWRHCTVLSTLYNTVDWSYFVSLTFMQNNLSKLQFRDTVAVLLSAVQNWLIWCWCISDQHSRAIVRGEPAVLKDR